jgi:hypothetical protein
MNRSKRLPSQTFLGLCNIQKPTISLSSDPKSFRTNPSHRSLNFSISKSPNLDANPLKRNFSAFSLKENLQPSNGNNQKSNKSVSFFKNKKDQ